VRASQHNGSIIAAALAAQLALVFQGGKMLKDSNLPVAIMPASNQQQRCHGKVVSSCHTVNHDSSF